MAACKYCGKWAGVAGDEHVDCAKLADEGKTDEEIRALMNAPGPAPVAVAQMNASTLFWIIFGALWAFSASAGILYAIIHALTSA